MQLWTVVLQILENSILSVSKSSHGKPDRPPHWKHFRAMVLPVFDKGFFYCVCHHGNVSIYLPKKEVRSTNSRLAFGCWSIVSSKKGEVDQETLFARLILPEREREEDQRKGGRERNNSPERIEGTTWMAEKAVESSTVLENRHQKPHIWEKEHITPFSTQKFRFKK